MPKFFESRRALRYVTRVLHEERVAGHQLRARNSRELIIGKVPRFDSEKHADRAALHVGGPDDRLERRRGEKTLRMLGVVREDLRTEFDLAPRFADALAHLDRHDARERIGTLREEPRRVRHDRRARRVRRTSPRLVGRRRGGDRRLEFRIGHRRKRCDGLSIVRVDARISHAVLFRNLNCTGNRSACEP